MKRENYAKHKPFVGETKPSMLRWRLDHDYTGKCMYLITMTTEGRQPLLGEVVGNAEAPAGSADAPRIRLSPLGEAVRREWYAIHDHHPEVTVMALQLMPDHLHGILYVESPIPLHLGNIIKFFKNATTRHYRELVVGEQGTATSSQHREPAALAASSPSSPQASSSPSSPQASLAPSSPQAASSPSSTQASSSPSSPSASLAPSSPQEALSPSSLSASPSPSSPASREAVVSAAAVPQSVNPPSQHHSSRPGILWSLGYNDHVLSSEGELDRWKNYLRDNPRRLLLKRQHPDYLRPHFGVQAAGCRFDALGNLPLLQAPQRLQVRVSRRCSPSQVQEEVQRFLAAARAGAVLVSPSISPGEKAVMRAAFDAHLPLIVLIENGFTPLTKPQGEQFDACNEGRLLLLAPWPHHNEKRKITAAQCQQLNLMATAICRLDPQTV